MINENMIEEEEKVIMNQNDTVAAPLFSMNRTTSAERYLVANSRTASSLRRLPQIKQYHPRKMKKNLFAHNNCYVLTDGRQSTTILLLLEAGYG
uniref:Uncharacterized protein n=1 Tax=Romanomermis culicivorax TaxID=13658 RepID=A0A915IYB6_ROMCU